MNTRALPTPAEIGDRHRSLISAAFLAIGLGYAAGAAGHLLDLAEPLRWLEVGATVIGVLLILWAMTWKARMLQGRSAPYLTGDGFVAGTVTRAHVASWTATFLVLAFLKVFVDDSSLPTEFFLQTVLAVMLLVQGVVFFVLNRSTDEDGFPEDDDA
ncbi:MAG TPA: hypothetical protein VKA86_00035 [Candidatus Krumholzibacteria bacterium]|nr:hypothetical protein [Candidatus Krumholzibacteria bacterium]